MDDRHLDPNALRAPWRNCVPQPGGPVGESHTPAHCRNPLAGNSFTGLRYVSVAGLLAQEASHTPFESKMLDARNPDRVPSGHVYTQLPHGSTPRPSQRTDMLMANVATFKDFEKNYPFHTPVEMADAGFSCSKHSDSVYCRSCDKHLGNWKPDDIPWIEHARLSPDCALVKHEMGQSFIEAITESFDTEEKFKQYCDQLTLIDESCKRFEKKCDEYQAQLKVSEKVQQQINLLKNERIRLFEEVNQQRQIRIKAEQEGEDAKIAQRLQEQYNSEQFQSPAPHRPGNFSSILEAGIASPEPQSHEKLRRECNLLLKQRTCRLCTNEARIFFINCGHLASCEPCSQQLNKCPFPGCNVRAAKKDKIKTFMS